MDPKTTEITIAAEGVVTITTAEFSDLVACRTMLDIILASRRRNGYADTTVLECVNAQRKHHKDMLGLHPLDAEPPEGEEDA